MTPTLFAAILASAVAAPAPPEEAVKPPQGPPPTQVLASVTKDGEFEITQPQQVPERRKEERTVNKDGKPVTYTVEVIAHKTVMVTRRLKAEGVTVYTTAGKEVPGKDVADKLKKPTVVLLAGDGNEVDPFYLKIVKPDTLVIVASTGGQPPPGDKPAVGPKPPPAGAAAEEAARAAEKRDEAAKRAAEEAARAEAARRAAEKKPD